MLPEVCALAVIREETCRAIQRTHVQTEFFLELDGRVDNELEAIQQPAVRSSHRLTALKVASLSAPSMSTALMYATMAWGNGLWFPYLVLVLVLQ